MSLATLIVNVHNALNAAFSYEEAVNAAKNDDAIKGKSYEEVRAIILPMVASYSKYAVPLVDGKGKAEGKKVLDSTHAKYEAATKAAQRLAKDIVGDSKGQAGPELDVPAHIQALADKLAKACNEYEQARKLASTAMANAFAK